MAVGLNMFTSLLFVSLISYVTARLVLTDQSLSQPFITTHTHKCQQANEPLPKVVILNTELILKKS